MKKKLYYTGAGTLAALMIIVASTIQVSANHVTIDSNLTVSPGIISFETVFPGEVFYKPLKIDLSDQFIASPIHDDVEYRILQRPKPRIDSEEERAYCAENPSDYSRCYPSLCPFLSKTPDGEPENDYGVPAFHDPSAPTSIATGRLAKSDSDVEDEWIIDLHTPCFKGECDQASGLPAEYQLDPSMRGEVFGCDLVIEITEISYNQCVEDQLTVIDGDGVDPTPLHIDSYTDMNTCNFATNEDVIVDGVVQFPANCPNGAGITAPAIEVLPAGSLTYTKGDGALQLKSTQNGITVEGLINSASKDPIKFNSVAGIRFDEATIRNSNNNGDVFIEAASNILIASSTVTVGSLPPATTGGDELKITCSETGCDIQILGSEFRTRVLNMTAESDITMHGSFLDGRDPRGNYTVLAKTGSVDFSAGRCDRPNKITNGTEGNLKIEATAQDVVLDDIFIRIPENIRVTAGNIVSALRADISNDFAKPGDIYMTAGNDANQVRIQDAKLAEDNQASHSFSTLNGSDNPATRGLFQVIGVPALDQ